MLRVKLAFRELRGSLKQLRVFAACLIIGVAVMATIGSIDAAVKSGIERDSRKILGGDVEVSQVHLPLAPELLARFAKEGSRVSQSIEMRTMASSPASRILVEMRGVDNQYPMIGAVELSPAMPLEKLFERRGELYGAAVEDNILHLLQVKVGDRLKIGNSEIEIRSTLLREPDRVVNAFTLGPRIMMSAEGLKATGLVAPGALINFRYKILLPTQTDAKAWIRTLYGENPDHGFRIRTADEASPGLKNAIDRLNLFLSLCGVTCLITAGIGIANALRSYLIRKQTTVAVLKCLGARESQVFDLYLIHLCCIALPAIALGLLAGATLPWGILAALKEMLPVDSPTALYPAPLILAALMGMLTTLIFGILPLAHYTSTKPAGLLRGRFDVTFNNKSLSSHIGAIALCLFGLWLIAVLFTSDLASTSYYMVGTLLALGMFILMAKLIQRCARMASGGKSFVVRMAFSNLYRPGATTSSVVIALGIGMSLLVALALIGTNMRYQISEGLPKDSPAFFLVDIQPDQLEPLRRQVMAINGANSFDSLPMIRGRISKLNNIEAENARIPESAQWAIRGDRGITYSATLPPKSSLTQGEWWPADYKGAPLISFDAKLAKEMGLTIGDSITVNIMGQPITGTIHNLREIDWTTLRMNFTLIFSQGALENLPITHLATIVATPESEPAILNLLGKDFSNVSAIRMRDTVAQITSMLTHISLIVLVTASLSVILGVLVMTAAIAANLSQRIYDVMILKTLGIKRNTFFTMYTLEFSVLALSVAGVSVLVGTMAAWGVMQRMILSKFVLFPSVVAGVTALCLCIALGVGLAAYFRVLKEKPFQLLRNE